MDAASVTEQMARSFLLGDVDASDRQRIESLFLTDPDIRDTILIVEDSLLEDYLEGNLAAGDTEKFRARYVRDRVQSRKLRIAQSIREHAIANRQDIAVPASVFDRLRLALPRWADLRLVVPALASLIIIVTIAAVWIGLRMGRAAREKSQRVSIEQQLADLNSPANLNAKPEQMLSITLAPISVRSVNPSSEVMLSGSSRVVELNLLWTQREEYPTYQAELSRVGGTKVFRLPPLQIEKDRGGRLVRLRLPAELLDAGLYRITLGRVGGDGTPGATEEYDFLIKRP